MPELPIERVVVVLTPAFGAVSAWLVAVVANNIPGAPALDQSTIEGIMISVFVSVAGVVAKWLHGRQIPAIAQLPPQHAEISAINAATTTWLEEHRSELAGPPGPVGPTPEQVRALVRDELVHLGTAA